MASVICFTTTAATSSPVMPPLALADVTQADVRQVHDAVLGDDPGERDLAVANLQRFDDETRRG